MGLSDTFEGFPQGDIIFRTADENLITRIHKITKSLVDTHLDQAPDVTYESYELNLAMPGADSEKAAAIQWPISREQYDGFWNPKIENPSKEVGAKAAEVKPTALDIFKPARVIEEDKEYDPTAAQRLRKEQERAVLAARLSVVTSLLDEVPHDPFIQAFVDSHGVFDRSKGESIPLGFNLDDIHRNIYVRRDTGLRPLFDINSSRGMSQGNISTITGTHISLSDGVEYNSGTDKQAWEAAIRDDIQSTVNGLRDLSQYYLDLLDETGYIFSSEHYGTERQIGTLATKEFFAGYYQFADPGITLLKTQRRSNLFGAIDLKDTYGVTSVDTIYISLKHGIAGRPHLVRLQAVNSAEPDEEQCEVHVFAYPHALDGEMLHERIGGDYGDLTHDPAAIKRMGDKLRSQIKPATLERILSGRPVGTEITGFSHKDFYAIVDYLTVTALSESDY